MLLHVGCSYVVLKRFMQSTITPCLKRKSPDDGARYVEISDYAKTRILKTSRAYQTGSKTAIQEDHPNWKRLNLKQPNDVPGRRHRFSRRCRRKKHRPQ
jgi:hypothetical protein